jgi:hypothetical protein
MVSYQVVIESSGFLLSIRGGRVTKNHVVLLVVYPKRPKPVRCCPQGQEGYRQF